MDKPEVWRPFDRRFRAGIPRKFLVCGAEKPLLEMRLALGEEIRRRRQAMEFTQSDLAEFFRTSQSRIAKMEAGDGTVSLDLLIRALIDLDARRAEIGRIIAFAPSLPERLRSTGAWPAV